MHIGFALEKWSENPDGSWGVEGLPFLDGANPLNEKEDGVNFGPLSEHLPLVSCKDLFNELESVTED